MSIFVFVILFFVENSNKLWRVFFHSSQLSHSLAQLFPSWRCGIIIIPLLFTLLFTQHGRVFI